MRAIVPGTAEVAALVEGERLAVEHDRRHREARADRDDLGHPGVTSLRLRVNTRTVSWPASSSQRWTWTRARRAWPRRPPRGRPGERGGGVRERLLDRRRGQHRLQRGAHLQAERIEPVHALGERDPGRAAQISGQHRGPPDRRLRHLGRHGDGLVSTPSSAPWRSPRTASGRNQSCSSAVARASNPARCRCGRSVTRCPRACRDPLQGRVHVGDGQRAGRRGLGVGAEHGGVGPISSGPGAARRQRTSDHDRQLTGIGVPQHLDERRPLVLNRDRVAATVCDASTRSASSTTRLRARGVRGPAAATGSHAPRTADNVRPRTPPTVLAAASPVGASPRPIAA